MLYVVSMYVLKKSVVFVGPDRCWKSTFCQLLADEFKVEPFAGRRGSEARTGWNLRFEEPTAYDRGIICARAYDRLFERVPPHFIEKEYVYCEEQMLASCAIYIFLDRDDFSNVNDEKDKLVGDDLTRLSKIYNDLLPTTGVPYKRFIVEDDTGTNSDKRQHLLEQIMNFIDITGGVEIIQ